MKMFLQRVRRKLTIEDELIVDERRWTDSDLTTLKKVAMTLSIVNSEFCVCARSE